MSTYTSQGNVRVEFNNTGQATKLYFVPDQDYSIKHRNKTFAVFVPQFGDAITREYSKDIDIEVYETLQLDCRQIGQTKVEIRVQETKNAKEVAEAAEQMAANAAAEAANAAAEAAKATATVPCAENAARKAEDAKDAKDKAKTAKEAVALKLISITIPAK